MRLALPHLRLLAAVLIGALCLAGCEPAVTVRGAVTDIHNQLLPGVSVTVLGVGSNATTDALGRYAVRTKPGALELVLEKTGYTPGRVIIDAPGRGGVEATTAQLWPLPGSKGVYLYEDKVYRETARAEPRRYLDPAGQTVFGINKAPDVITTDTTPLIIAHRLPSYDVRLRRLANIRAALPNANPPTPTENIWIPTTELPALPTPIDEPEHVLVEISIDRPLAPGDYALDWGAFDGFTTNDSRVFFFRVQPEGVAPEAPEVEAPKAAPKKLPDTPAPAGGEY